MWNCWFARAGKERKRLKANVTFLFEFSYRFVSKKDERERREIYPKGYPVALHHVQIVLLVLDLVALPRLPPLQNKGREMVLLLVKTIPPLSSPIRTERRFFPLARGGGSILDKVF